MDGRDLIDAVDIGAVENEAVVDITVNGADESHGDAVGDRRS